MIEQISLETEGFRFSFDVDYAWTNLEHMGMVITFQLLPPLRKLILHSKRSSIAIADLHRLCAYFEQHMAKLKEKDGDVQSDVFLNWELGFKLQAFEGNIDSPGDESFTIFCLVNISENEAESCHVYVGGESNVTFEQVRAFTRAIQMFTDELPTLQFESFIKMPDKENGRREVDPGSI